MPCLAPRGAPGPGLPRGVTPRENSLRAIGALSGGRSTSTQWKKSTRGSVAGTVRPSLFTSSPRDGTSGSWQISASDFVPAGTSLQRRSGFIFSDSLTCVAGSSAQNARSAGMRPLSANAVLVSRMDCSCRAGFIPPRWVRPNKFAATTRRDSSRRARCVRINSQLRLPPMRRNRLVEIRQCLDALLPPFELGSQQAVGVEVGQLDAGAEHECNGRIQREVRGRQRSDEKLALHVLRHLREFLADRLARVDELLRVALLGLCPERVLDHNVGRLDDIVVDLHHQPPDGRARLGVAGEERRAPARISIVQVLSDRIRLVEHEVAVDQRRHRVPRIERDEFRLPRVAGGKRKQLALVRQRLVLERELNAPRERRTRSVVQRETHPPSFALCFLGAGSDAAAAPACSASSDAFCSSIVLMLICMKLRLIVSQFSMTRSSPIFLSISAGSSVANIASGFGNGAAAGATPGAGGGITPGIDRPKGFHIFCMNSSACCGVNGDGLSDIFLLFAPVARSFRLI